MDAGCLNQAIWSRRITLAAMLSGSLAARGVQSAAAKKHKKKRCPDPCPDRIACFYNDLGPCFSLPYPAGTSPDTTLPRTGAQASRGGVNSMTPSYPGEGLAAVRVRGSTNQSFCPLV